MKTFLIYTLGVVLLSALIVIASDQFEKAALIANPCPTKLTCSQCIQTAKCAWCMETNYTDRPRCFQPDLRSNTPCPEEYVVNPDNEASYLENAALTRGIAKGSSGSASGGAAMGGGSAGSGSASGSIVQIQPQHVGLKLRVDESYSMSVKYSQAVDYPVDLYYLMDLSKSMEDDKEKLSALGDLLADTMKNITSNFRLGFGSFVDKVLMPYVSTVPKKLKAPCDNCVAPYGYINHMTLSNDTKQFASNVKNAHVSGNLDAPEGGFDAIMQAVVCEREIGWRTGARRLLLFSTDAGFHYAGDGKLGGVITPNDGECHLEGNVYDKYSKSQDYPSISQINLKVKEKHVNVIFAVTQQQVEVYKKLSKHVEGSSAAMLSEDSSNIVDLVRDEYNKITSEVELKDNASEYVKIKYFSKCLGTERIETNKCGGLKVGDVVEFDMEISVTKCPPPGVDRHQKIRINPVAVDEALIIDLEMICSCGCETSGPTFELDSEICKRNGKLSCGICECYDGFFGRNCECNSRDLDESGPESFNKCRPDNTTDIECSGRGNCICGQCHCTPRKNTEEVINGKFCECDNFSCDRYDTQLCSGPEHGECVCGVCSCKPGWGGNACECSTSTDKCKNPLTGEICSSQGDCVCGKCECKSNKDIRYSGKYCEKCPTCPQRCELHKACVECQMYKKGPLKDPELCRSNCTFIPVSVDDVEYDEDKDEHLCTFFDEDECRYRFVYNETFATDGKTTVFVRAQQKEECPPKIFFLGVILGVIAAIVLIGIAMLLLWKLLTTIHDRREFARFEKERMMAKWDTGENPIYKQATSTFKNPTYAGK